MPRARVGGPRGVQPAIAMGHDHTLALGIDENRRQRCRQAVDAPATGAVDPLARERGEHAIAVGILPGGAAEWAGQRRPSAESRDGDRGVGGAAAIDREKAVCRRLRLRLRKALDLEDLVEHDDSGAQDRARAGASGTQPLPPLHSCFQ